MVSCEFALVLDLEDLKCIEWFFCALYHIVYFFSNIMVKSIKCYKKYKFQRHKLNRKTEAVINRIYVQYDKIQSVTHTRDSQLWSWSVLYHQLHDPSYYTNSSLETRLYFSTEEFMFEKLYNFKHQVVWQFIPVNNNSFPVKYRYL